MVLAIQVVVLANEAGSIQTGLRAREVTGQDYAPFAISAFVVIALWLAFRWRSRRPLSVACSHCGADTSGKPRITLLGQRKIRCDTCSRVSVLPMSKRYLVVYLALFAMGFLSSLGQLVSTPGAWEDLAAGKSTVFAGGLGMIVMVALTRDMLLRIKLRRRAQPAPPENDVPPQEGSGSAAPSREVPPLPKRSAIHCAASKPQVGSASPTETTRASSNLWWVWALVVLMCITSIGVVLMSLRFGWNELR